MTSKSSIKLGLLAKEIGAELKGDPDLEVYGINTLLEAKRDEVSFLTRDHFLSELSKTNAAAVIVSKSKKDLIFSRCLLIGENPHLMYAKTTQVFKSLNEGEVKPSISKQANIHPSAEIDSSATIKSFASISENVVIQEGVTIGEGVCVGKNSLISSHSKIYPNVSIYSSVEIGRECIIHSGTVIGSDGLGFARNNNSWEKVEHVGGVIIGDRVEIGSNTSIDRGSVGSTKISDEVKIDNLVHIAHNVLVGSATVIAANSAIAGSTKIGKNCTIAGCCGIVDNIEITDSVHITAMTLVTKSIKKSGTYSSGTPIMENREWKKNAVAFKKLKDLINDLK